MALTEQEKRETLQRLGVNAELTQSYDPYKVTAEDMILAKQKPTGFMADIKGIGTGIKEDFAKRTQNVADIRQSGSGGIAKTFKTLGQSAGAISDVIGQTFMGGVKALTPQFAQEKIGETVQSGVQKVVDTETAQKLIQGYQNLSPEQQQTVGAIMGFGSLGLDVVGAGLAKKGVTGAVKTTIKGADKSAEALANAKRLVAESGVAQDILPTKKGVINTEITKAFDLTQGDVKNIYNQTGNEVGDFVARNNLIGNNIDETKTLIDDYFKQNYDLVRSEIDQVKTTYKPKAVPRYKDALNSISKQVDDVVGLEKVAKEVKELMSKKDLTLKDAQRVKELMDEHLNLYKITGDVKESATKEGLANIRREIQTFIENEVKNNTGADIRALNKEVQTSKAISKAVESRITRGSTRATITAGDVITFLTGSGFGSPVGGVLAVLGKKLYQSPSFKLRFTKWFNSKKPEVKAEIIKAIEKGEMPKGLNIKK